MFFYLVLSKGESHINVHNKVFRTQNTSVMLVCVVLGSEVHLSYVMPSFSTVQPPGLIAVTFHVCVCFHNPCNVMQLCLLGALHDATEQCSWHCCRLCIWTYSWTNLSCSPGPQVKVGTQKLLINI